MFTTILATLFVFGILVSVHEFGHFAAAKLSGMKVLEFAVGFGPGLYKKQKGETLYSLRSIPLGGYTKIAGMDPDDPQDPRNFDRQSLLKRLIVIVAGSFMNLMLPIALFFLVIFFAGVQKPVDLPVFGAIMDGYPAALAGLEPGDEALSVNGEKIATWSQLVDAVKTKGGQSVRLLIRRGGAEFPVDITPRYDEKSKRALIGVSAQTKTYRPGLWEALETAFVQTYTLALEMLKGFYSLLSGRQQADLAGPLGVARMAGEVAQYGFLPLLNFTAFLSINLGIINLFPVPVLDGGHVATLLAEAAMGRPLSLKMARRVQYVGLALLFFLLIFSTLQDIGRLNLF
ncbi:MAG: RIP metalloprotease RseP [Acidaminococcales bacterium]|jgi:regulator of sigma E protease|nr:RIP metalloprotease RseP [Acidaminococcales bacterium]